MSNVSYALQHVCVCVYESWFLLATLGVRLLDIFWCVLDIFLSILLQLVF